MQISEIQDTSTLLLLVSQSAEMMSKSLYKNKELFAFWNDVRNEADEEANKRIILSNNKE